MRCQSCGQELIEGAIFCNHCGARVQSTCPTCGAVNPQDSAYCNACGSSLAAGSAADAPVSAPVCPRCQLTNVPDAGECVYCGALLQEHILGGFWRRFAAWFIDYVVLSGGVVFVIITILPTILPWPLLRVSWGHSFIPFIPLISLTINLVVGAFYYTIGVSVWSTTLGKKALGLRVLRADGSKIGGGRAFARWLAYFPSFFLLGAGFLMIAFRQDKRGLHDLICETVVVKR